MEDGTIDVATPDLDAALVKAQSASSPATKDGYNDHHGYDYTSAETVIHLCSAWLNDAGLALAPLTCRLQRLDGEWMLQRVFVLSHTTGQQRTLVQDWPVVPGKGRPLDKAVAVADTASLSYLLRTLLLMPRVEEGLELDSPRQDDSGRRAQAEKAKTKEEPRREEPRKEDPEAAAQPEDGDDDYDRLWRMVYDRCMDLDSNVEPLTDEQMDQVAEVLFRAPWRDLSAADVQLHLGKFPKLSDERLNQLVGGFLVPF